MLRTAKRLDVKLFIAESQRLVKCLTEEELLLLENRVNFTVIENNLRLNKLILELIHKENNTKLMVRQLIINF